MRIWKKLTAFVIAGVMTMSFVACGNGDTNTGGSGGSDSSGVSGTITGSGSSALLPLAKNAADAFKEKNPDVSITLNAGGSGTGLKQVSDGTYPVWGYEHMYTKGEATGAVKAYIDYIMSDEYSGKLEEQGYGVTSKMTVQR